MSSMDRLVDAVRDPQNRAVVLAAPPRGGKTAALAKLTSRVSHLNGGDFAVETAAGDVTWAAVNRHARAFAQRRLHPPHQMRRKLFVVDDLDVFVACDRGCVAAVKSLIALYATGTIVFACTTELAVKLDRAKIGAKRIDLHAGGADTGSDVTGDVGAKQAVATVLGGANVSIGELEAYIGACGGHMFVDTLAHNAACSSADDYFARLSQHVVAAPQQLRTNNAPDNDARTCAGIVRAAVWRGACGSAPGAVRVANVAFTNSLAMSNVYAGARRRIAARARENGVTVAEAVFGA